MGKCRFDLSDDCHNKDCLACVLDKIRAEIIEMRSKQTVGVLECLDIIDKYKTESEGKDNGICSM